MSEDKNIVALGRVEEAIEKMKTKDFTLFFYVVDSRNVPNSMVAYIYEMALTSQKHGYNVMMLYQLENEYTEAEMHKLKKKGKPLDYNRIYMGVGEWMGEEYAQLPHMNIAREQLKVAATDILFIPEVISNLMFQTYKYQAPCKRVAILQNFNLVTDFIPVGVEWKDYGMCDAIAISQQQADLLTDVFPYVKCKVLKPKISDEFRKGVTPKKLKVNIIAKDQRIVNKIVKTFYWKYPIYKFVSLVDLRGYSREDFAEHLKESPITVWVDNETTFGHTALEAMKCGNMVIGKVPEVMPEWMNKDGVINDCCLFTYNTDTIPDILAKAIGTWMQSDGIPEVIEQEMEKVVNNYTSLEWEENVPSVIKEYVDEHIKNFEDIKASIEKNIENNTECVSE